MKTVQMPGMPRPVAQLALGTGELRSQRHADEMLDAYAGAGGDLVDTAWVYRAGECERLLGDWLRRRANRNAMTVIGKGAHTPLCEPRFIAGQLTESLERLHTGHVDVYMLHRDNRDVPVAEFVDAMMGEVQAGRIREYGFSNWTLQRLRKAFAYARGRGIKPPTALSYNYSLADMVAPVWEGVVAANGPDWRALLTDGELALYSWSSQARGFFTDRAEPGAVGDLELVRCWFSRNNLERRRRAYELAEKRGVTANQVALAWTLHQPFPLAALIGPLTPAELADSIGATQIALTPDELAWLRADDPGRTDPE
ncbi:MAG TPA: aldo/keto reductase [Devosiaceae bacterium]|nr:aldo/keto reductase [Devosiaceae bacterium]